MLDLAPYLENDVFLGGSQPVRMGLALSAYDNFTFKEGILISNSKELKPMKEGFSAQSLPLDQQVKICHHYTAN